MLAILMIPKLQIIKRVNRYIDVCVVGLWMTVM